MWRPVFVAGALVACSGPSLGTATPEGQGLVTQTFPTTLACGDVGVTCSPNGTVVSGRELTAAAEAQVIQKTGSHWYYNYKQTTDTPTGVPFVPLFFYTTDVTTPNIAAAVAASTSGWLAGFNEPNNAPPQASATVAAALTAWQTLEAGTGVSNLKLLCPATGSPYTTTGHNNSDWFHDFWLGDANRDGTLGDNGGYRPRCDAVAWHYYTGSTTVPGSAVADINTKAPQIWTAYGLPTWITEFDAIAFTGNVDTWTFKTPSAASDFMQALVDGPFAAAGNHIARWVWYPTAIMSGLATINPGYDDVTLVDLSGNLKNPLGVRYSTLYQ